AVAIGDAAAQFVAAPRMETEHAQQRVLAAVLVSQKHECLAALEPEGQPLQLDRGSVGNAKLLHLQDRARLAHARSPSSRPAASRAHSMSRTRAAAGNAAVHQACRK